MGKSITHRNLSGKIDMTCDKRGVNIDLENGMISPQFHVQFDMNFYAVRDLNVITTKCYMKAGLSQRKIYFKKKNHNNDFVKLDLKIKQSLTVSLTTSTNFQNKSAHNYVYNKIVKKVRVKTKVSNNKGYLTTQEKRGKKNAPHRSSLEVKPVNRIT